MFSIIKSAVKKSAISVFAATASLLAAGTASAGVMTLSATDLTADGLTVCTIGVTAVCDGNDQAGTVGVLDLPGANVSISAIVGTQLTELERLNVANDGVDVTNGPNMLDFDMGSDSAGTVTYDFSGSGFSALYVAIKGGPEFAILKIVSDMLGDGVSGSFTFDLDVLGISAAVSHVSFYGTMDDTPPIPVPGAIWLMIAGVAGLGAASRKKKPA
ncbi:VPLPA-CTERM sorting domain-containing protein [Hyphococcus flavus]|uniref:VPLPA-CTERM sorting domain-containing protein n=1 Tax=Hyphococcus flavus TaxID=1866326 RepID=A0AAE9ZCE7_9PROT|nr:VPLPA-CTERM sorting domain-containing protein [Hyphococcus flavus]WDI30367.1 VPLPA-CTERM sorting domain-containing protein [Hyphococcus flavus]